MLNFIKNLFKKEKTPIETVENDPPQLVFKKIADNKFELVNVAGNRSTIRTIIHTMPPELFPDN